MPWRNWRNLLFQSYFLINLTYNLEKKSLTRPTFHKTKPHSIKFKALLAKPQINCFIILSNTDISLTSLLLAGLSPFQFSTCIKYRNGSPLPRDFFLLFLKTYYVLTQTVYYLHYYLSQVNLLASNLDLLR